MADQKALKKRLKVLMQRPENQVCSDCPEKKPTWASLIVAPPGAPPGTPNIGAFCCLECSGSHRRLGVHISFVRSVNLDSWKEHEVQSMENGGNFKVNTIFEARLAQSGRQKPTNLADGPTRERFIRDKYERRKFFDSAGYAQPGNSGGPPHASSGSAARASARAGSASDVARQRVASRQARMKPSQSQLERPAPPKPKVVSAPVSAPVDLLDFGDFGAAPAPSPTTAAPDPFAIPPVATQAPPPVASIAPPPAPVPTPAPPQQASTPGQEFMPATPAPAPAASNDSIMALFNTPAPRTNFAMQGMGGMPHGRIGQPGMGGMMMNQNNMMMNQNNMQQQPGMQQMGPTSHMMGINPQMMMGMNPQMMAMMQQQQPGGSGMTMNNNGIGVNATPNTNQNAAMNNNYNAMLQGVQQMNVGNQSGMQQMTNMGSQQQMNMGYQQKVNIVSQQQDDGGFGAPMGGSASQGNDPFASLGGMNAFR
eukprot:CAMPEP_0117077672 /NCGR_PEP_ID=MMETSP0472-20121206/54757_1 /TAXON_ID=693140 ORGANISM="Tiarina fusus, Strain LIS" /NCGR_SAMPLE_ID=MMETSP0472 /ASSEMBLY_ACC=CAM_ASM_000603 /LENGTH=479 /DNA_ID=CAMNT_0004804085 /DNA_START=201 /DNA_END=1640 /DNA_ORIENTATION=+